MMNSVRSFIGQTYRGLTSITLKHGNGLAGSPNSVGIVVAVFLRELGGQVSDQAATAAALTNDNHRSAPLVAAKSALQTWGVTVKAAHIGHPNAEDLAKLSFPIIAITKDAQLFTVLGVEAGQARLFDVANGYRTMPIDTVFSMWSGVVLYTDHVNIVSDPDYPRIRPSEIFRQVSLPIQLSALLTILLSGVLITSLAIEPSKLFLWLSFIILSPVGLGASLILLSAVVGNGSSLVRLCKIGEEWNCLSVLASRHAKILGISYVDIGIVYFSGMIVITLLDAFFTPFVIGPILLFPIFAGYFLYVQKVLIKQWCSLCLVIHAAMVLMSLAVFVTILLGNAPIADLTTVTISALGPLLIWLAIAVLWSFFRPQLGLRSGVDLLLEAHQDMMFSDAYFKGLASSETSINLRCFGTDLYFPADEKLGNGNEFGILLSAGCPTCGQVLSTLLPLLEGAGQRSVSYRVRILPTDETSLRVTQQIMALAKSEGPLTALKALNSWIKDHEMSNYDLWEQELDKPLDQAALDKTWDDLDAVFSWVEPLMPELQTPSLYVNGKPLPSNFVGNEFLLAEKLSTTTLELPAEAGS